MSQHMNTQIRLQPAASRYAGGFSLIEVMVALIIVAVGMLGIAKMQALALSTTASSGVRSLVAIEAASLAASMHYNRDYWGATPPTSFTVGVHTTTPGTIVVTITDPTNTLNAAANCQTVAVCTAAQLAAYDVQQWGTALGQIVPAALATINCQSATAPNSCNIQITWQENVVATNNAAAAQSSAADVLNSPQYTLYVEP
jgi:type IV pilus assembly protein PilV